MEGIASMSGGKHVPAGDFLGKLAVEHINEQGAYDFQQLLTIWRENRPH